MTKHEFIFSDKTSHRIVRHLTFWMTWWMYFLFSYYYPGFQFRGWNIHEGNSLIAKYGFAYFLMKTLFINTLVAVVLPQALFTYCILLFALPRILERQKSLFITILLFLALMAIVYMIAVALMYIPVYHNILLNPGNKLPGITSMFPFINITYLFNIPIVAGFAILIKLMKKWLQKQVENEQLAREKNNAELQLLKAQVHPHFLFNTLNNIYFFTLNHSPQAPLMIKKLSSLLQYIFYECDQSLVPVEKEIQLLQDYLSLEKIRYGEKLNLSLVLKGDFDQNFIAPLLLIPFVENSFKHGASKMIKDPWIRILITSESDQLHFSIANSKPANTMQAATNGGIGIKNVQRRLQLLYPGSHQFIMVDETDHFHIQLNISQKKAYDLA